MQNLIHSYTQQDIDIKQKERCFDGFFKMTRFTVCHRLFEGGWGPELQRERFDRGAAVGVLMYDKARDLVILTEQFRIGALEEESPWVFEVVAGIIEAGETPEDVAIREAEEESGAHIKALQPICEYLVSPGGTDEKMHLFYTELDSTHIEGIHGLASEGEDIKIHKIKSQTAFSAVESGEINNAATVIALQWLELALLKGRL